MARFLIMDDNEGFLTSLECTAILTNFSGQRAHIAG